MVGPTADHAYLARVWVDRLVKRTLAAYALRIAELRRAGYLPTPVAAIALGIALG